MNRKELGTKIRAIRKLKGLSQSQLAVLMGYKDHSTLAKVETGVNDITVETLFKYAEVLETNVEDLLGLNHKTQLLTDRLILRKVNFNDARPMFNNWASDPEVTKYLTWPTHQNIEVTKKVVEYWIKEEDDPKTIRFMITIKGKDEPIGAIDVVHYIDGAPEIGYCLSRKHWGKGYMTEACKALIKYLFDIGFSKVLIEADVRNIGSNRVIEKCGFVFTHKEEKEHCSTFKKEPVTVNWYEINK